MEQMPLDLYPKDFVTARYQIREFGVLEWKRYVDLLAQKSNNNHLHAIRCHSCPQASSSVSLPFTIHQL